MLAGYDLGAERETAVLAARATVGGLTDPVDDERTNVFQRWESKEDLAAHILAEQAATPEPAPATPWLKMEVVQCKVGAAEPLGK